MFEKMFEKKRTIYLFILMVIAAMQGVLLIQAEAKSDIHALIDSTHQWVDSERVLVTYQDFYKADFNEQNLAKLGRELEASFDFPAGSLSHSQEGRPTFLTSVHRENFIISLKLTAIEEYQTHYLTITLESTGVGANSVSFNKQTWLEQQVIIEQKLSDLGLSDKSHITIEGALPTSFNQDTDTWRAELINALELKELESYQDHRTLSVSYYSPLLSNHVLTDSQKMNLQIALSYDSHKKQWRVTIGSPIITIEY